jgi:hypothetical protein
LPLIQVLGHFEPLVGVGLVEKTCSHIITRGGGKDDKYLARIAGTLDRGLGRGRVDPDRWLPASLLEHDIDWLIGHYDCVRQWPEKRGKRAFAPELSRHGYFHSTS